MTLLPAATLKELWHSHPRWRLFCWGVFHPTASSEQAELIIIITRLEADLALAGRGLTPRELWDD